MGSVSRSSGTMSKYDHRQTPKTKATDDSTVTGTRRSKGNISNLSNKMVVVGSGGDPDMQFAKKP